MNNAIESVPLTPKPTMLGFTAPEQPNKIQDVCSRSAIERAPLCFKLLMVSLVSILSMLIFGSWLIGVQATQTAKNTTTPRFLKLGALTRGLLQQLQLERGTSTLYLSTRNESLLPALFESRRTCNDSLNNEYMPYMKEVDSILVGSFTFAQTLAANLTRIRHAVDSKSIDPLDVVVFIYDMNNQMVNMLTSKCLLGAEYYDCIVHNNVLRLTEEAGMNRALGTNIITFKNGTNTGILKQFIQCYFNQQKIMDILYSIMNKNQISMLDSITRTTEYIEVEQFHLNVNSYIFNRSSFPVTTDAFNWFRISTVKINSTFNVSIIIENNALGDANYKIQISIVVVVIVVCLFAVCWLLATCTSFCFSKSIIGPWKTQNKSIARFVPKDMLYLLQAKQIRDVNYGMVSKSNVVFMDVELHNFDMNTSEMTATERLKFVNDFFNELAPIIRQHSGFIQKYAINGFVTVFKSTVDCVLAAIKMQRFAQKYDTTSNIIRLHIGISSGEAVVSTIGETQRIDVIIYSEASNLASSISKLNASFKSRILTTLEVAQGLPDTFNYRTLGSWYFNSGHEEDVFEIIDPNDKARFSAIAFAEAAKLMEHNKYEDAIKVFEHVQSENPKDYTADVRIMQCKNGIENYDVLCTRVSLKKALSQEVLHASFLKFCKQELSYENIYLWKLIQSYNLQESDRQSILERIKLDYLQNDSKYCVNLSQQNRKKLHFLYTPDFEHKPNALQPLQTELELLMEDTYGRFRLSEMYKLALHKMSVQANH